MSLFKKIQSQLKERALEIDPDQKFAEAKAIKQILKQLDALGNARVGLRAFQMENSRSPIDLVSNVRSSPPFGVHGITPKIDNLFREIFDELGIKNPVFFTNDQYNRFLDGFGVVSIFVPIGEGDYYYSEKIGDIGRYVRVNIGRYLESVGRDDIFSLKQVKDSMFKEDWFKKMKKDVVGHYKKSKQIPKNTLDEIIWTGKRYWLIRLEQTSAVDSYRIISEKSINKLRKGKRLTYADVAADIRETTGIDYK